MTKKEFVSIANTIKALNVNAETRALVAHAFAAELLNTNQKFNVQTFLNACVAKENAI
jgi:hypothetical protein